MTIALTLKHLGAGLVALSFALAGWAGGDSSDGHTHAVQVPAVLVPASLAAPRMSTETEQFELVGVLEGKVLTLYLDQFATNAPVAQAQIEVESGAWKAVATEVAPAVYVVPAEWLTTPGKHPLAFTVQAGEESDLMSATLEVGQPHAVGVQAQTSPFWRAGSVVAALSLVTLAWVVIRRRKQTRQH